MINFLKNIFAGKKAYKILGRGGISFFNEGQEYYIESNNFLENPYDVEIFYKDIRVTNSKKLLSEAEKKRVACIVKDLLEKDGLKTAILPV